MTNYRADEAYFDQRYAEAAKNPSAIARFFARQVRLDNGCIEWTGGRSSGGYGNISVNDRNLAVFRLSWYIHKGPVPEGLLVCHSCDNRPCVNPDHLFLGTPKDNTQDMLRKGRRPSRSATTAPQREEIRRLVASGISQTEAGRRFGISQTNVSRIVLSADAARG